MGTSCSVRVKRTCLTSTMASNRMALHGYTAVAVRVKRTCRVSTMALKGMVLHGYTAVVVRVKRTCLISTTALNRLALNGYTTVVCVPSATVYGLKPDGTKWMHRCSVRVKRECLTSLLRGTIVNRTYGTLWYT